MKFSEQWLREWVNPPISHEKLLGQLTMLGLEVDSSAPVAGQFTNVIIGSVLTAEPHPDAKKLSVCTVDVGGKQPLNIVCGASNVRAGLKVAVAMVGARLPNGLEIKDAVLRGAPSRGMLCSAKELELAETSEGILELPQDAPIGKDLREYWQLDDFSIDIDLTPNRGDCLSIRGVAREVGVINSMSVNAVKIEKVQPSCQDTIDIHLNAGAACPRYLGRVINNTNPNATSPMWLQEKLRRSGLRSISPIVDITNFILIELGQPLHAFDRHKIQGGVQARLAKTGESLTLLDGKSVTLDSTTMVIADDQQALAIAGIMGGLDSSVTSTTTDIFLECAYFSPAGVAGRARRYGLSTDSSHRFERGVDPELCVQAIERATALLLEIVGGQAGPVHGAELAEHLPKRNTVRLRPARIERVLGIKLPVNDIRAILTRLEFQVSGNDEELFALVPSHRFDVSIEEDLIEEVARVHGYDHLPVQPPHGTLQAIKISETKVSLQTWVRSLVARGYSEVITYSFVDPVLQQKCFPDQPGLTLLNPLSQELSVMRVSLWPGLLQTVLYNQSRQMLDMQLLESGLRFLPQDSLQQIPTLSGVRVGQIGRDQWHGATRPVDFYDIKADVESLLAKTHNLEDYQFVPSTHPTLHPGQCAELRRGDQVCGWLGMLHPRLVQECDLIGPVGLFELDFNAIQEGHLPKYHRLSKFPSNRRDMSFLVDKTVLAAELLGAVKEIESEILQDAFIFDVYQGKGIPESQKSVAMGFTIAALERTLVDQEISDCLHLILEQLTKRFAIQLRD